MKLISTNPSRNYQKIGEVDISTAGDVKKAYIKAREAFPTWSSMSLRKRCDLVESFVKLSEQDAEEIAQLIARETGRVIKASRSNVLEGIRFFRSYMEMAEKYLSPQVVFENDVEIDRVYKEPLGVVATICPWNYPFENIAWQCGQALIAGNTILFKNSEENPLFASFIEKLIRQSKIPEGVFNILYGDGKVGQMMLNEEIDMVSFTGSSKVGQIVYQKAGKKFIPAVLELGGSSPGIVFEDIDLNDELISYISDARFNNNGQLCDAVKRLLVHESKFDEVLEKLTKLASQIKVGDALNEDSDMGPLVAKRQLDLLESQVNDAIKKGAKVEIGGKKPGNLKGAYFIPTVLTNIKKDMRVWKEEVFGPVLPIIPFETEKESIELANDTEYGLSAHIFTADRKRFRRVAAQIKAGSIAQNTNIYWNPTSPFGGYKKSGMGRVHGEAGFDEVTQIKLISEEK